MSKVKARCPVCKFNLTSGDADIGDPCPWCHRGVLEAPPAQKPEEA